MFFATPQKISINPSPIELGSHPAYFDAGAEYGLSLIDATGGLHAVCGRGGVVMTSDEKFAAAAHLYVLLRRKSGRVVDTVWLLQNKDYALEVFRLAREQLDDEVITLADRLEVMMFGGRASRETRPAADLSQKYVHTLR